MDDLDQNIERMKTALVLKLSPKTYATNHILRDRVLMPSTFAVSAAPEVKTVETKRQPDNRAVIAQPPLQHQLPDKGYNEGVSDGVWAWLMRKFTWTDRH